MSTEHAASRVLLREVFWFGTGFKGILSILWDLGLNWYDLWNDL